MDQERDRGLAPDTETAEEHTTWKKIKKRIYTMVSVGVIDDKLNQSYDIISTLLLVINIVVCFAMTFEDFYAAHYDLLHWTEAVTVFFFAVDYVLRLITADMLYPEYPKRRAVSAYFFSAYGIVDLLSFLPYYLPVFFPAGATVFRLFRVIRIFRLFRVNAYSDALGIISKVIYGKRTQITASVFIILLLMMASSLCMYSVEHQAQPGVFKNAFSGIWWAASTLLTIGYGDIYPITIAGKAIGMVISFLGVGMVAIPTGIISAGFVEEYQKAQVLNDIQKEEKVNFIEVEMHEEDGWVGRRISELGMPKGTIIATIIRGKRTIIPRGDIEILGGDKLIICAESPKDDYLNDLKEIELRKNHSWNGQKIRDLDLSRQTFIVLIARGERMLIPDGDLILHEGDRVLLYTKENIHKFSREPKF